MASHAAGELLAAHMTGGALPSYAEALSPARYADPVYRRRLEAGTRKPASSELDQVTGAGIFMAHR